MACDPCYSLCAYHDGLAKETQCRAFDQSRGQQLPRAACTGVQRGFDLVRRQSADVAGDEPRAEIAVGLQFVGGNAENRGMAGQIDGIGDDGGGGVGLRRRCAPAR